MYWVTFLCDPSRHTRHSAKGGRDERVAVVAFQPSLAFFGTTRSRCQRLDP